MNKDIEKLVHAARTKVIQAVDLVEASLRKLPHYEPGKITTPDEQEPYDALSDRFMRAVEISLKFFRTYEYYMYAEKSETIRDLLNRMEKLELISQLRTWMEMRDLRNRIVHDYLPGEIKLFYDLIMDEFAQELQRLKSKVQVMDIENQ